MSHFSVLVIHDENASIEELLVPYDERLVAAPHLAFTKQEAIDYVRKTYSDFRKKSDDECWKYLAEKYETDKDGNLFSTSNPKARWDSWQEGGRWENFLKLKNGERASSAKLKDIDFGIDQDEYKQLLRFWDIVVEHAPLAPGEERNMPLFYYKEEVYREIYKDRETFAKEHAGFATYAVVTPNGVWQEKGRMGWWGMDNSTPLQGRLWSKNYYQNFIENENEEMICTIVDCHI